MAALSQISARCCSWATLAGWWLHWKMLMGRWQRLVVRWNLGHGRLVCAGRLVFLLRIVHVRLLALQHFHVLADKVSNLEGLSGWGGLGENTVRIRKIHSSERHQRTCAVVRITFDCFLSEPVMIMRQFMLGENDSIDW